MTVKQLKVIISELPDNMDVFVAERKSEFTYGMVNSAVVKKINFVEEINGEVLAQENVLVLDEE